MQVVIDIPDATYEAIRILGIEGLHGSSKHFLREAFANRKELPKGHGRLIDADNALQRHCDELCKRKPSCENDCIIYDLLHLAPTILETDEENADADSN